MRSIARNVLAFAVLLLNHLGHSKVFERCELAQLLRYGHGLPEHEVAHWVCIAEHQSAFDSSSHTGTIDNGAHGLFQISDVYWCSPPNKGMACGVSCDRLRDDDLTDDLACIRHIYEEHQRISGDGYNAWTTYQPFCRGRASSFIEGCFTDSATNYTATQQHIKPYIYDVSNAISEYLPPVQPQRTKIYDRCELAKELRYRHKIPVEQIATWVCIANHESNFNTAAIGRLNADGSLDHGLFQISDIYWCSPPGKGLACRLSCDKLEDTDITDDVECIKKIHTEHERISGDGFTAWAVYEPYCQGRSDHFIDGCFDEGDNNSLDPYLPSESIPALTQSYSVKPRKKTGKVYSPCELADELRNRHRVPEEHIAIWVCIARYESNFNTSALGNGDHGLFQISDIYWCSPPGKGWACGLSCADLEDDDITDDVQCIRKIYEEHQRLSGDGFNAWVVYPTYCNKGRAYKYIEECTRPTTQRPSTVHTLPPFRPALTAPTKRPAYEKHYSHINRISTTTQKPFTFNSFSSSNKFPSTNTRFGGFSFSNNQRTTKPSKQNNFNSFGFNSGFTNRYSASKTPFAFSFDNSVSATHTQSTILNTQDVKFPTVGNQQTIVQKNSIQNQNVLNFGTKATGKTTIKPKSSTTTTTTHRPKTTTRIKKTTSLTTAKPTTSTTRTTTTFRTTRTSVSTPRTTTRNTEVRTTARLPTPTTPRPTISSKIPTTKSTTKPTTKPTKSTITTTKPTTKILTTKPTPAPTTKNSRILTTRSTTKPTRRTTKTSTTTRGLTTKATFRTTKALTTKRPANVISTTPKTPYSATRPSTTWRTTTKPVATIIPKTTSRTTRQTTFSKSGTTKSYFSTAGQHSSTKRPSQSSSYYTGSKTTTKPITLTSQVAKPQNLQKTTIPPKKSVFDIYDGFTKSAYKKTQNPFSATTKPTVVRTTTRKAIPSSRTTTKSSFTNIPLSTKNEKLYTTTAIPSRGFKFGVAYSSPTSNSFGITTSKTTTKSPFATVTTKSSPFSTFISKSPSSKQYHSTPLTTRAPTGTSKSPSSTTTKAPSQRLFSFLSAPLPLESSTPSPTKSWFDDIFDRFKHK